MPAPVIFDEADVPSKGVYFCNSIHVFLPEDTTLNKSIFRPLALLLMILSMSLACNLPGGGTTPPAAGGQPTLSAESPSGGGETDTGQDSSGGEMQVRFVNLTDGGTVDGTLDKDGKPVVLVQVEVSGAAPVIVDMTANDVPVPTEVRNPDGVVPFTAELAWHPLNGGGAYTIVVTAMTDDKQIAQASAHVTVTGIPVFTATPPPLDQAAAQRRFAELYQQLYGVNIPAPSQYRFDSAQRPDLSRWISSVYFKGQRYYIELYDDTHYQVSPDTFAERTHQLSDTFFIYCRPAGLYKILVVFVDYGNTGVNKDQALAQVPPIVKWINQLYTDFAVSQGFKTSPLQIEADAAYIPAPPSPGNLLTAAQIKSATGADASKYDFVMQIDLDANNTMGEQEWKGILESGGGIALQGCGAYYDGNVNIWSVVKDAREVQGVLVMDFNHELSHLFGMMDNWPFGKASLPDGTVVDDWIPYVTFGWTDADGDGVPEVIDPTPYGTSGP